MRYVTAAKLIVINHKPQDVCIVALPVVGGVIFGCCAVSVTLTVDVLLGVGGTVLSALVVTLLTRLVVLEADAAVWDITEPLVLPTDVTGILGKGEIHDELEDA